MNTGVCSLSLLQGIFQTQDSNQGLLNCWQILYQLSYQEAYMYGYIHTYNPNNDCKTQNSGLRSKEEKPHDPINEPSRCNMQEGLLSVAQTGDSDLLGGRAHRTANWASFYGQKATLLAYYIRVTK